MNSFQFLSYYSHGLTVSLFTLFVREIHLLSFQPVITLIPLPLLVIISTYPGTPSYLLLCLHKAALQCRPKTSWSYFLTPYVSTSMCMRNMYGLKADHWCNSTSTLNMLLSPPATRPPWFGNPSTMSCIRLTYFSDMFVFVLFASGWRSLQWRFFLA